MQMEILTNSSLKMFLPWTTTVAFNGKMSINFSSIWVIVFEGRHK